MVSRTLLLALAAFALLASPAARADNWAGKQVKFIVGSAPGGGYDHLARLASRHLGRHMQGEPSFVVQNMPTGNSVAAANFIANVAPRDGSYVALLQRGMLLAKMFNPGAVQFDIETMSWIASLNSETGLVLAWHTAPHTSARDLFERELIVGAQTGVDPEISPRVFNALLGTKFRIVTGYQGTTGAGLAMERGEVQGIGDWSLSSLKAQRPQWIERKQVRILLQAALERDKDLPDVPNALDFVKNETDREALRLYFTQKTVARPVVAPPGVAPGALADLRKAYMALASDSAFLEEAEKANVEVSILSAEAVEKVVAMVTGASPQVRGRLIEAMKQ
ncbi:MAG: tripartite tricarboxylate transporter family receptor [Hyphomicrobiales bacterium]|nr:tripartite tricarboxylate transporter family receptor [Hyphomicrobiales bacterium]